MDETEEQLQEQILALKEKLSVVRRKNKINVEDFQYLVGKCFKEDNVIGKILSLSSEIFSDECIWSNAKVMVYNPGNISIYQDYLYTVVISEIDSLLIPESEFLEELNKGFEEIKNY